MLSFLNLGIIWAPFLSPSFVPFPPRFGLDFTDFLALLFWKLDITGHFWFEPVLAREYFRRIFTFSSHYTFSPTDCGCRPWEFQPFFCWEIYYFHVINLEQMI